MEYYIAGKSSKLDPYISTQTDTRNILLNKKCSIVQYTYKVFK